MIGLISRRTILTKNIRNFRYFNYSNILKKKYYLMMNGLKGKIMRLNSVLRKML